MTDTDSCPLVAVLGTGLIGAAVARNLTRKGFAVRAWNRTAEKARTLSADGVDVFDQPADAVRDTSIIVTVLKDGAAVGETMNAALSSVRPGATWLQLSTVGVEATDTLARLAIEKSIVFYDSPVQGTRQPAEQGKLVILASGPEAGRDIA